MEHQINVNQYIDAIKRVEELKEIQQILSLKKQELDKISMTLVSLIERNNQLLSELKELANWKNKLFKKKHIESKVRELKSKISLTENEIKEKSLTKEELTKEIVKKELDLANLEKIPQDIEYRGYEEINNNKLVITDKPAQTTLSIKSNVEKNSMDNFAMVHCTDFFPQNDTILCNYDGNKMGSVIIEYKGVRKEVKALSHRHTVHFTFNNTVESTSDGKGVWEQPKYIVVEPFSNHLEQFIKYGVSRSFGDNNEYISGDNYTIGSVTLNNPYYLVREDELDKLPDELREKENIIVYRGDARKCLQRFLQMLGYPIYSYEPNDASHSNSLEMILENATQVRDLAVNFMQDNSFDGKEKRKFTLDDIIKIIEIEQNILHLTFFDSNILNKLSQEFQVSSSFIDFVLASGIKMDLDGSFYFDSDKNIYDVLRDNSKIDLANLKKVCEAYKNLEYKEDNKIIDKKDIGSKRVKDIYRYENFSICQIFFKELENLINKDNELLNYVQVYPYISDNGIYVKVFPDEEVVKIASMEDDLSVAYNNLANYINTLKSTNYFVRGGVNVWYLLYTGIIILIGIYLAIIIMKK